MSAYQTSYRSVCGYEIANSVALAWVSDVGMAGEDWTYTDWEEHFASLVQHSDIELSVARQTDVIDDAQLRVWVCFTSSRLTVRLDDDAVRRLQRAARIIDPMIDGPLCFATVMYVE